MKFLTTILFLFFFEFANTQVAGTLGFVGKSPLAQSFTFSVSSLDFSSANVTARIINNGAKPVTISGILWGLSVPTITSYTGITTNGDIAGNNYTNTMTGLAIGGTYYIVAYATNEAGTSYGNVLTYTHGTVYNATTGKTWLAVNLGATAFPTSISDSAGYGTLYQWGRLSDGHQYVRPTASSATSSLSGSDVPNNGGLFIVAGSSPYDWRSGQNANLWQGVSGINNPCPSGFRLPTTTEFTNEKNSWNAGNADYGAFTSVLKLTYCGRRYVNNTNPQQYVGIWGYYWTSDTYNQNSYFFRIKNTAAPDIAGDSRGSALAVRCIQN